MLRFATPLEDRHFPVYPDQPNQFLPFNLNEPIDPFGTVNHASDSVT